VSLQRGTSIRAARQSCCGARFLEPHPEWIALAIPTPENPCRLSYRPETSGLAHPNRKSC